MALTTRFKSPRGVAWSPFCHDSRKIACEEERGELWGKVVRTRERGRLIGCVTRSEEWRIGREGAHHGNDC